MASILIITSGLTGIANASLELGRRLVALGHEVTMSSMRDLSSFYDDYGFAYHQMPFIEEEISPELPSNIATSNRYVKRAYSYLNRAKIHEQAYQQMYPRQFIDDVRTLDPDLLIIDTELHEFIIPTYAMQKPMLILSQWFQLRPLGNNPYLLTDSIPGEGVSGTGEAIEGQWAAVRKERAAVFARKAAATYRADRRSLVLRLAAELEFPTEYIADNFWPGPVTYSGLPMISMTAVELEFSYPIPKAYTYIGPMVYKDRKQQMSTVETDRLSRFLQIKNATGSKLILCTVSTMSAGDLSFIQAVATAVASLHKTMLVVGLGGKLPYTDLALDEDRVLCMSYVPMLQMLPEADLSINHGGIHTINECLTFGVPMLVYSGKKSDQNGCAARVHYHKIGIRGDKDCEKSQDIAIKIMEILQEPIYKKNISRMRSTASESKYGPILQQVVEGAIAK